MGDIQVYNPTTLSQQATAATTAKSMPEAEAEGITTFQKVMAAAALIAIPYGGASIYWKYNEDYR